MNIVKLEDFFDFKSKKPINRLAYTKEDLDYKIKCIKKMQELGMAVSIDNVGNICGTISVGENPKKVLAIGSHTDSVYDGGQYDGPVGVVVGLQVAESLINSHKCNGIIKVAIYACEESSRFGNACIGSKYLSGVLKDEDFDKITDQKAKNSGETITLRDAINYSKSYLSGHIEGLEEVDKIFENADYSLEAHIEQYEILHKKSRHFFTEKDIIGIVTSIGSAVRVRYHVKGQADHTGSTPMRRRKNAIDAASIIGTEVENLGRKFEKKGLGRASQVEISTPGHNGSFNQIPENAEGLIDFRLLGENTPENVLKSFDRIKKSTERKTRTIIKPTIVSQGRPVITSSSLNVGLAETCSKKQISHINMPSYAGQDTGYIPAKEKTMIFIPSTGGSHNPNESTKKRFIEAASTVFTEFSQELLVEKFKDRIVVDFPTSSSHLTPKVPSISINRPEIQHEPNIR